MMDENDYIDTLDDAFLGDNMHELQNTKPIMIEASTQTKKELCKTSTTQTESTVAN
jgi:hypothetical protein